MVRLEGWNGLVHILVSGFMFVNIKVHKQIVPLSKSFSNKGAVVPIDGQSIHANPLFAP
jgi:hypothetical protein